MTDNKNASLKKLVYDGATIKKIKITDEVLDRISYELSVIEQRKAADYFILYARIIQICNELNLVRSPGRGSAMSSLVNYCLDIIKFNPLNHDLIFEKFINPKGTRYPDIDIDIPKGYRQTVINILKQKHPEYHTYFIAFSPQYDNNYKDIFYKGKPYKKHPCGIVITTERLTDSVINYENQEYYIASDISTDILNTSKIDIVELAYLNSLQAIVAQIGNEYHPFNIPLNDITVIESLQRGENENIFELNTPELAKFLIEFKPKNINDLAVMNAIYRPGPNAWIPGFLEYKANDYEIFQNPLINSVLKESYGILIFQETFVHLLHKLCGFSYAEADIWRIKLIKSKPGNRQQLWSEFLEIFTKKINFLSEADTSNLCDMIEHTLQMTFQKSHSLSYATVSYWGAYYKTYFKSVFEKVFREKIDYEPFELF